MSLSLRNKNVLVTGGSRGLGACVVQRFAAEGANVVINYVSAADRAEALAKQVREEYGVKALVICADVGSDAECKRLVKETVEGLGGLDVIISNAGWTKVSDWKDLYALGEEEWDKCWAVNVKANLHLLRAALPTFNANPDGGSLLITSSIAGIQTFGSAMAYSVSKAAGLHLMRCLAYTQGPKVRVNAVQPGLLMTEWGRNFPEEAIERTRERSKLKVAPTVEECADAFVLMAKSSSMTSSTLKIDGGLYT
ncbi:NAD(P)-binding protein [Choiromyces venosus 120613-1]|uniref:NAD(P)-binding protein n=1 Tax=Choiromyces venosus 120613-1 TaxID=1336337 RepID=A0A3N4IZJ2_9PEZI|nr:NAD(P)-binding protein [Choiromyces venosus 120613-1]